MYLQHTNMHTNMHSIMMCRFACHIYQLPLKVHSSKCLKSMKTRCGEYGPIQPKELYPTTLLKLRKALKHLLFQVNVGTLPLRQITIFFSPTYAFFNLYFWWAFGTTSWSQYATATNLCVQVKHAAVLHSYGFECLVVSQGTADASRALLLTTKTGSLVVQTVTDY